MILPFLKGLCSPKKALITWILFSINLGVYVYFLTNASKSQEKLENKIQNEVFLQMQARVYSQFIIKNKNSYSYLLKKISSQYEGGQKDKQILLASFSLRDPFFLKNIEQFKYKGDQVSYAHWLSDYRQLLNFQAEQPSYSYGININHQGGLRSLTYQFVHGGFFHLLTNMWFLLIFGCLLEPIIGHALLLGLYLSSGLFGAFAFAQFSGLSLAPLIGASGSVSGLMGLFSILFWRKRVAFYYFVLPQKGYNGFIHLPGWVVFLFFTIVDIRGHLETIPEFGGVAHMAHFGGAFIGLFVGLTFLFILKYMAPLSVKSASLQTRKS